MQFYLNVPNMNYSKAVTSSLPKQMTKNNTNKPSAKTLRNRRRRARRRVLANYASAPNYPGQVGAQTGRQTNTSSAFDRVLNRMQQRKFQGLTQAGLNFLKCAFAPPDFSFTGDNGIPDGTQVRRLLKRHRYVNPLALAAGADTYILVSPIPGVAYFAITKPAGSSFTGSETLSAIPYADAATLFPSGGGCNIVNRFRFVSNCFELVPTANEMTWSGNITCYKVPIEFQLRQGTSTGSAVSLSVTGLQALNGAVQADQFTAPFNHGVYTTAVKNTDTWKFVDGSENNPICPGTIIPSVDFCQLSTAPSLNDMIGMGGLESIIIKISGVTTNESAIIKTWACVEYTPVAGSQLYEYASAGPVRDQAALDLYNELVKELPIGVPYYQNAGFWDRVLSILRGGIRVGSALPGPYGMAFQGADLIDKAVVGMRDLLV